MILTISKILKEGKPRIKIVFEYDRDIKDRIKKIPSARFSKSLKAWHIEYSKKAFNQLKSLGIEIKYINDSGTIGFIRPTNDITGIDLKKSDSVLSKNDDSKNADIDIDKRKLNIEIHNKNFYIKTGYNPGIIEVLKSMNGAWWNGKYKVWIAKADVENLDSIQNNFSYWQKEEYEKIYEIVALIDNPLKLELYRTPDNIKKVWVKIRGYRADIDFLKHLPERFYDKRFKRWNIPNDTKVIKRVIEHYKQKGAKIINRLPEKNASKYNKKEYSYGQKQDILIEKYPEKHKELVKQLSDVMIGQRYSWSTITSYTSSLVGLAKHIRKKELERAEVLEINKYLAEVASTKISGSKLNIIISAIKFYYTKVIFRPDFEIEKIKRPRKGRNLPNILSKGEIEMILGALTNLKHITLLYTIYSSGLRLNEILNLRVQDISFDRNQIFVKKGKGNKDRVVMLSEVLKLLLIKYTDKYKPVYWLFEGRDQKTQYSASSVQKVVKLAAYKAGITKPVTPHKIRHCFATHLLDEGTDLRYIQELLGHKDIKTTLIYTHVTTKNIKKIKSPLDNLNLSSDFLENAE